MALQNLIGYVRENVDKYGMAALLHDAGCRVANKVMPLQILRGMTAQLQDVNDPAFFEAPGFEARFVGEDELEVYARQRQHDFTMEFLREARARGDRCYALFDGANLAAYGWYSSLPTPIDDHFLLHFDPSWIYMYKDYTVPAYRGRRLHAVGMCRALRAVTEEGKKGLISWVLSNNFASLRSCDRMGYRIFGSAWLMRAGGHSHALCSAGCRQYGFSVEAMPTPFGAAARKPWNPA